MSLFREIDLLNTKVYSCPQEIERIKEDNQKLKDRLKQAESQVLLQ